jgi:alpha-beta hydrolase superfamily lysophospholipase
VELPVIRRSEDWVDGARGDRLFRREWLPEHPERALLLAHGMGEHSGRYEHFGAWFATRGCAVHAYDHLGHGRSAGLPGHVQRFDDYLDDLEVMLAGLRQSHPQLPVFLIGHSMGGLIAAAFARERRPQLAGVVTSGAALQLGEKVSGATAFAARILSRIAPRLRLRNELDPAGLSRDPEVVAAYVEDPLVFRRVTTSMASELFRAIRRTGAGGAEVQLPMLMLHGEADPICPVGGTREFFERLPAGDKALQVYPGLLHEIFNEPERERVFEDLLAWLRERKG